MSKKACPPFFLFRSLEGEIRTQVRSSLNERRIHDRWFLFLVRFLKSLKHFFLEMNLLQGSVQDTSVIIEILGQFWTWEGWVGSVNATPVLCRSIICPKFFRPKFDQFYTKFRPFLTSPTNSGVNEALKGRKILTTPFVPLIRLSFFSPSLIYSYFKTFVVKELLKKPSKVQTGGGCFVNGTFPLVIVIDFIQ